MYYRKLYPTLPSGIPAAGLAGIGGYPGLSGSPAALQQVPGNVARTSVPATSNPCTLYPVPDSTLYLTVPSQQTGLRFPGSAGAGAGCVLLVSNMSETETECDHLFILFGVYGDVQVMAPYFFVAASSSIASL